MSLPDRVNLLIGVCSLLALWVGWLWKFRPRWRRAWARIDTFFDTFNGREESVDQVTGKTVAEVPALGTRLGNIEKALTQLAEHRAELDGLQVRVGTLEQARAERIVNQFETGQILRMAADERGKPPADEITPPHTPEESP